MRIIRTGSVVRGPVRDLITEAFEAGSAVILCDHQVARSVSYHSLELSPGDGWVWSRQLPDLLESAEVAGKKSVRLVVEVDGGRGVGVDVIFAGGVEGG